MLFALRAPFRLANWQWAKERERGGGYEPLWIPLRTSVTSVISRVSFLIWLNPAIIEIGTNWSASIWVFRYSSWARFSLTKLKLIRKFYYFTTPPPSTPVIKRQLFVKKLSFLRGVLFKFPMKRSDICEWRHIFK